MNLYAIIRTFRMKGTARLHLYILGTPSAQPLQGFTLEHGFIQTLAMTLSWYPWYSIKIVPSCSHFCRQDMARLVLTRGRCVTRRRSIAPPSVHRLFTASGNLGSHLLDALLRNDRVQKLYTLNRPHVGRNIKKEHEERFADKGLDAGLLSDDRLVFLEGDTSEFGLGLTSEVHQEVRLQRTALSYDF